MRVVAFYLPQFYPIPENDRWWGPGFTEWVSTRKATPLFPGHVQPREPLDQRYYSLLDPVTREWQATIARRYGVDAFCYYHYWFNGRRLLERPFEEVLRSGRPDFPFCLSWANEPWTRSWNGRRREILMPQEYGGRDDWDRHFEYLAAAFRDPRYLRVDGRPLFVVYRPTDIPTCQEMMGHWRTRAVQLGFGGLHLLHVLNTFEPRPVAGFDGVIELEPMFTISHGMPPAWRWRRYARGTARLLTRRIRRWRSRFLDTIDYDKVVSRSVARDRTGRSVPTYLGAFPGWDNTPRRGREATVVVGSTPEKFGGFLEAQLERAGRVEHTDLVFINAWNEWAEGAYMEPDAEHGLRALEELRRARQSWAAGSPQRS